MPVYLLIAVTILSIAFLWLGDYGDCKNTTNFIEAYWYRFWALWIAVSLVLFLRGGGYIDEDGDFISYESRLWFFLIPFFWFVITSIISNYLVVLSINILSFVGFFLRIGKNVRALDLSELFLWVAIWGLVFLLFLPWHAAKEYGKYFGDASYKGVCNRFTSGYKELHCEFSSKFRWLRNKCAMRLGFYKIYAERFNTYYSRMLNGEIRGSSIFRNELDSWIHGELKRDYLIIIKNGLLDAKTTVNAAIILSCYMILKNDKELAKRVGMNKLKNHAVYFDVIGSALVLCRETIETMKNDNTLDLDNVEIICKLVNEMSDEKCQIVL